MFHLEPGQLSWQYNVTVKIAINALGECFVPCHGRKGILQVSRADYGCTACSCSLQEGVHSLFGAAELTAANR